MQKLRKIIENLGYEELMKLKKEMENGEFKKIIEQKIRNFETTHEKACSVCYNDLEPFSTSNYTLVFGPDDFRKKARFCAFDCLQYFLDNLRMQRGD